MRTYWNADKLGEYQVRTIEEDSPFKESALVLVAVAQKNWEEVIGKLAKLGFGNYICINYQQLFKLRNGE